MKPLPLASLLILIPLDSLAGARDMLLNRMPHRTLRILTLLPILYLHLFIRLGTDLSLWNSVWGFSKALESSQAARGAKNYESNLCIL